VEGKGWTPAGSLKAGDRLLTLLGDSVPLSEVDDTGAWEVVYNLRVADHRTYFVGDDTWSFAVWAHNRYLQTGVEHIDQFYDNLKAPGKPLNGKPLIAAINMNDPGWLNNNLDLKTEMNRHEAYVYLVVDRDPANFHERIVKVGSTSQGTNPSEPAWQRRFEEYRHWAIEGMYWLHGVRASGQQLTVYVFSVPKGQEQTIENQVRKALYTAQQRLPRDYTDQRQGGRWEDFNTRPPGAGDTPHPQRPVSNLDLTNLLQETDFTNTVPTPQNGVNYRVVDVNHSGSVSQTALADMTGKNWIYIVEARSLSGQLILLKVGSTTTPHQRITSGGTPGYRTASNYQMSIAIHFFEVNQAFLDSLSPQLQSRIDPNWSESRRFRFLEGALRQALYAKGYLLPIDHSDKDSWRNIREDLLHTGRNNTVSNTLSPPNKGRWA
jgi:hypothetical protein